MSTYHRSRLRGVVAAALAVIGVVGSVSAASNAVASAQGNECSGRTVVLLHGTWSSASLWDSWTGELKSAGYCPVALDYGQDQSVTASRLGGDRFGVAPVTQSSKVVAARIKDIAVSKGGGKVSLVTHSQGGLVARLAAVEDGAAPYLDTVVTLASTAHGTIGTGATDAARMLGWDGTAGSLAGLVGQAAVDQLDGSPLMNWLADQRDTAPDVRYLSIITSDDIVATPPAVAGFLHRSKTGQSLWNVDVRDCLPTNAAGVGHSGILDLPQTKSLTLWALGHGDGSPKCSN